MRLYAKPANLFVAGFLGSPAMNFLRGTLRQSEGLQLELDGGVTLPLGTPAEDVLRTHRDRRVVVGLRPEDLQPVAANASATDAPRLRALLEVVEPVGNEAFLNLRHAAGALVARVAPQALPPPGGELELAFLPQRLHFFDADDGRRIGPA
jgi:multiple sugar transport system ATP-binding protein